MDTPDDIIYIQLSTQNIDKFISRNEYKRAFGSLILVLERLNDRQKTDMINYYSKNLTNFGFFTDIFPSR